MTVAFGNKVALTVDRVNIEATCASALPKKLQILGDPIMYCAILCIALTPQSGDSSGAILGVRSVALLHLINSTFWWLGVESEFARSSLGVLSVELGKV